MHTTLTHETTADGSGAQPQRATINCSNPATGGHLGDVRVFTPQQVREAVVRSRTAQSKWSQTSFAARRRVLSRILQHLLVHADELCEIVVHDSGKTRENAMLGEIWPICEKLRHTISKGERYLRPERVSSGLLVHKRAQIVFQPLGVIGIICPWNYPLQNVLGPAIPALMAGNGAVIKVSEWTSWSANRIQQIFDEALSKEGLPTDLVQLVTGYGETGAALVSSGVDKVIFTGSMANGRRVLAESAKTLTPVVLELGGKDAMIICDDAHLEQAVHAALAGVFIASGQNCLAAERLIVQRGIYAPFVSRVTELVSALRQGDPCSGPVDIGALTMPRQVEIIEALVADAISKGARLVVGGKRRPGAGHYFEPTVLAEVTGEMTIAQEETFGPVMCIMCVDDDDEALRVANATQYGLSATVMSTNPRRASRIASQLMTGGASVNDFGMTYMAQDLPFGGLRGSGFGRLNGREGLRAMTNARAILTDRFQLHRPARLYPVGESDYAIARSAIRAIYSRGIAAKARSAWQLLHHLWRG